MNKKNNNKSPKQTTPKKKSIEAIKLSEAKLEVMFSERGGTKPKNKIN